MDADTRGALDDIKARLEAHDRRFESIERRLDEHSKDLARLNEHMMEGFNFMYEKIDRLDAKLEKSIEETRQYVIKMVDSSRDSDRQFQDR